MMTAQMPLLLKKIEIEGIQTLEVIKRQEEEKLLRTKREEEGKILKIKREEDEKLIKTRRKET